MGPIDKLCQGAPTSPAAPSSFRLSSVAPTLSQSPSPVSPVTARTPPLPDDRFVGCDAGPDPTVAIGENNVEGDWELRLGEISIGGSRQCTISIPDRGMSARHCLLDRRARARKLLLYDLDSSHGTFFREQKLEGSVELRPGDMFTAPPVTFVCLSEAMRQHRPTVFEILGSDAARPPDWVVVQAATGSGPMLLTGEAGCDLDRLASAIHGMTSRRLRSPIELAAIPHDHAARTDLIQQASKTSLILSLDDESEPLPPDVVSKLFDARLGVRFIVIASSPNIARRVLTGAKVELMQHVPVRPLADRKDDIRKLLDRQFAKRGFCRRVNDLTPVNQDALKTYPWPGNFAELREVVDGIIAHAKLGGLRPAAESLGISHQKLDRRFRRVGLKIRRLFGEGE